MEIFKIGNIEVRAVQCTGYASYIDEMIFDLGIKEDQWNFSNGSNGKFHLHENGLTQTANVGDWVNVWDNGKKRSFAILTNHEFINLKQIYDLHKLRETLIKNNEKSPS